jgi:hypothetical protein
MIYYVINNLEKKEEADFSETYYFWHDVLTEHQI